MFPDICVASCCATAPFLPSQPHLTLGPTVRPAASGLLCLQDISTSKHLHISVFSALPLLFSSRPIIVLTVIALSFPSPPHLQRECALVVLVVLVAFLTLFFRFSPIPSTVSEFLFPKSFLRSPIHPLHAIPQTSSRLPSVSSSIALPPPPCLLSPFLSSPIHFSTSRLPSSEPFLCHFLPLQISCPVPCPADLLHLPLFAVSYSPLSNLVPLSFLQLFVLFPVSCMMLALASIT